MIDVQSYQQPDTREPSDQRKAELEVVYEKQKDTESPYRGVKIHSLGELEWIRGKRGWAKDTNDYYANKNQH